MKLSFSSPIHARQKTSDVQQQYIACDLQHLTQNGRPHSNIVFLCTATLHVGQGRSTRSAALKFESFHMNASRKAARLTAWHDNQI